MIRSIFCKQLEQRVNTGFCENQCECGKNLEMWKRKISSAKAGVTIPCHTKNCVWYRACENSCMLLHSLTDLQVYFAEGNKCPEENGPVMVMDDSDLVSVIILARNEPLLQKTIDNLAEMARGAIEFIVVLDGPETQPPRAMINLTVIRHNQPEGRRPSTNEAVKAAKGKYLFHVDAHVKTDTVGWDLMFKELCDDRTMVIPSLDKLKMPEYQCKGRRFGHKYITCRMKDSWSNIKPEESAEETICGNGMGWFLTNEYYNTLGGCDEQYGRIWGNFGLEWALKVWLTDPDRKGPGRVVLSRDIVFAHQWKESLGYKTPNAGSGRQKLFAFVDGTAPNQVRPFSFFEEHLPHLIPNRNGDQRAMLTLEPAVTAIMNTNGLYPELIAEAVESFLRQDYNNKKLLIVNTHPNELEIENKPDFIEIQNIKPFERFPQQIAYAIKQVATPYWCVMDSDDIFKSNHISQLVSCMNRAKKEGIKPPCYIVVPKAWEQWKGKSAKQRKRGWWCCLYSKLDTEIVDQTFNRFMEKSISDTGSDLHFIKRPWWNKREFEDTEITVLHRLGVGFHIRRERHNPGHYKKGIQQAAQTDLPVIKPGYQQSYFDEPEGHIVNVHITNHLGDAVCAEPAIRNLDAKGNAVRVYSKFPELFRDHPAVLYSGKLEECGTVDYKLKVRRGLHLVDWLTPGVEWVVDRRPRIYSSSDITKFGIDFNRPTVVISTRTHAVHKRWNKEKWMDIVRWLRSEGYQTVQVGINERNVHCDFNLSDQTSLAELIEICRQSRLYVGIDAGVQHVAVAVNTPAVVLYGPADPNTVIHSGWTHAVHREDAFVDCWSLERIGRNCPKGDACCMFSISVDEVKDKINAVLYPNIEESFICSAMDYLRYLKTERNTNPASYGNWQKEYCRMIGHCLDLRDKRILDVGCCLGNHVKGFVELCGADAYGCDIVDVHKSPFYKKRHRLQQIPTDRLGDYYKPESFDVIHSSQVFEHFPGKEYSKRVIEQIRSVLKPGGIVYVSLVTGKHRTAEDVLDDLNEDSTHVNIWPMEWWFETFAAFGFKNVNGLYDQKFAAWPMYKRYQWSQMFWIKQV